MKNTSYLSLQPTEQALTIAACQIFAAYIASGQVQGDTEVWIEKSINEAIMIGQRVDDKVIVPGEMS
jgi:hypothetical protein